MMLHITCIYLPYCLHNFKYKYFPHFSHHLISNNSQMQLSRNNALEETHEHTHNHTHPRDCQYMVYTVYILNTYSFTNNHLNIGKQTLLLNGSQ